MSALLNPSESLPDNNLSFVRSDKISPRLSVVEKNGSAQEGGDDTLTRHTGYTSVSGHFKIPKSFSLSSFILNVSR